MTPEDYVKEVIEDRFQLEDAARTKDTDRILAPFRKGLGKIDDCEFDRLVDQARTRHHLRESRKKR